LAFSLPRCLVAAFPSMPLAVPPLLAIPGTMTIINEEGIINTREKIPTPS